MRNVILQEFVTLDGLASGRNDEVDFVPASTQGDQSFGEGQLALMETIDTILLGRVTYQLFADYWPGITEGPDKIFADRINAIPKIVFSKTLDRAPWGKWDAATVISNDAAGEVANLKRRAGQNLIVWGSISLAQSLIDEGLIDEYRLVLCPIVLGSGKPLFRKWVGPLAMKLSAAETFDRGAVQLTYNPECVAD